MQETGALFDQVLGEAGHLLQGLASNELIGLYVIQDDRFAYVSPRLADLFDYSQEALCGGMGPMDLTSPEHRALAQGEIDRRVRGETRTGHYRFHACRKDGSIFDAEVFGVATQYFGRPAIVGILVDVSERCDAERAVQDQLRLIVQLLDTIPNPVYYKDEKGRYLGCNKAFEQFVGIERERLVGRTVYDIAPGQAADRYFAADQELLDKPGTQTYEASVTHADRSKREVVYYKATFNKADGSLGGIVGVMLDISDRKNMEDRVWREANYDALTGLPNRRLFRDRMREEIKRARRTGRGLALLFIDLDRFKEVNDTLGHDAGDQLLIDAAQRICTRVRATDTVSRPGGDEFIVILPDIAEATQVGRLAGEIIEALVQPFQINAQTAYVSASIGVALFPDDTDDMDTLLSYADQAMYAAKEQGRNCFSYFTPSMQEKARLRMQLANDLRQALPLGQLQVYLQPIVNLSSGLIVKAEALLRWRHPLLGMVPPDRFIPIAEEIGLINEIGDWVFREAAAAAKRWSDPWFIGGSQPVQVSVNKSPRQLVTGNTEKSWIEHLRQIGLPNGFIVIEITEGLLMDSRPEVAEKLLDFRDAGIEVSLDDFGTGYSAMSYLKKFDIDYLKIDKSFIRDMTSDPSDRAIVEAIIVMAHKLGMKVVAEGVETAEQRDLLEAAGCDFGQGYFFARPMPIPDFEAFLVMANKGND